MTNPSSEGTESMVERVARALCVRNGFDPDRLFVDRLGHTRDYPWWHAYADDARAAIEAMKEPTEAMDLAAVHAESYRSLGLLKTRRIWNAMIDAALAPPTIEVG